MSDKVERLHNAITDTLIDLESQFIDPSEYHFAYCAIHKQQSSMSVFVSNAESEEIVDGIRALMKPDSTYTPVTFPVPSVKNQQMVSNSFIAINSDLFVNPALITRVTRTWVVRYSGWEVALFFTDGTEMQVTMNKNAWECFLRQLTE